MGSQTPDAMEDAFTNIVTGMREWHLQHPDATLREIEVAMDERYYRVRARLLEDLALEREAANWQTQPASDPAEKDRARLLEQLMQVARTSALEEMASGFAHELNQPIGAIATFAQAAARMLAKPDPPLTLAADVLTQISNAALHAGEGIHRIRNLFNGREGKRFNLVLQSSEGLEIGIGQEIGPTGKHLA